MANISITGNIGRDPELRQAGTSQVLKFSVADSEYIYVKGGEEAASQWYSCEVWGKQAERLAAILVKGTKVTVYGQLVQRPYTSKAGKEGISMDVKDGRVSIVSKKEAPAGGDAFGSAPF
jgi:single-strand DNA-binding protein